MRIQTEKRGEVLVARVEGELDLSTAASFREAIDQGLSKGSKHLVLNLARLTFLDSSGLGVILGRYRRVSEKGGRLLAVEVPPNIERLLALSGLQRIIVFSPTETDALRSL